MKIYLEDGPFSTNIGIVKQHPKEVKPWVAYLNGIYFDSYGFGPQSKLSRFIKKRNGPFLYFEYKIQGLQSFLQHIGYIKPV